MQSSLVWRALWCVVCLALVGCGAEAEVVPVMKASDAMALPRPAADLAVVYGDEPLHFGELRLPDDEGPHPVVIVIHGGCWLAEYDLGYISGLADALRNAGFATWSIEYRRVGDAGGGWPGTFEDVAAATDFLVEIAPEFNLDLARVAAIGHSAGGHLALWLAGRRNLEIDDPLRGREPLSLNGVVALAGIPDLASFASPDGCGAAVSGLLGDEPDLLTDRLRRSSPVAMVPLGVTQILIIGERDPIVPRDQADALVDAARGAGDEVRVVEIPGVGHFELVDPTHGAFEIVRSAVAEALQRHETE